MKMATAIYDAVISSSYEKMLIDYHVQVKVEDLIGGGRRYIGQLKSDLRAVQILAGRSAVHAVDHSARTQRKSFF